VVGHVFRQTVQVHRLGNHRACVPLSITRVIRLLVVLY
jgi:hypothetical protein